MINTERERERKTVRKRIDRVIVTNKYTKNAKNMHKESKLMADRKQTDTP